MNTINKSKLIIISYKSWRNQNMPIKNAPKIKLDFYKKKLKLNQIQISQVKC